MCNIVILGAGGFGCSLAALCGTEGHKVWLWTPFEEEAQRVAKERQNAKLLPGVIIPDAVVVTSDATCVANADLVIIATPSFAVRSACAAAAPYMNKKAVVACVSKGFEPETLKPLSDVINEEFPKHPCVIISGPSHAEEIAKGVPTTVVAASANRNAAEFVQDELMCSNLRIYANDDILGVELGGALKNVIALAAGICDGLKLGDNSKAALMTRGITEIARLGIALGAKSETFAGLSGIGDLIVTCTSMHSRNRRTGILIGQGKTAKEAIAEVGMTVEGYTSAKSAYELCKKTAVDMPIITETYKVLYENKNPEDAIKDLMGRPKRHESEVIWLLTK